jgi:DNA repair exonuclease SbcCD ATPase subunit
MIIERIEVTNFLLIKQADIALSSGIYWLEGRNLDELDSVSNGSGKTTLLRAIAWALFGDILVKGLKADGVIGPHAAHCQVKLTIRKGDRLLVIDRARKLPGRRTSDAVVYVDGNSAEDDQSRHKNNTQYIERLLGIHSAMFYYAAYAEAGAPTFCDLSATEMLQLCTKSLELELYDAYSAQLKKWIKDYEISIKLKSSEQDSLLRQASMVQDVLASLDAKLENFETARAKDIAEITEQIEYNRSMIQDTSQLSDEVLMYKDLIDKNEHVHSEVQNIKAILMMRQQAQKGAVARRDKLKITLSEVAGRHDSAKTAYENLAENMTNECAYCCSKFNPADLKDKIKGFEAEMNKAVLELVDLELKLQTAEDDIKRGDTAISEKNDELLEAQRRWQALDMARTNLELAKAKLASIANANKMVNQLTLKLEQIKSNDEQPLKNEIADYEAKLAKLADEYKASEEALADARLQVDCANALIKMNAMLKRQKLDMFIISLQGAINAYLEDVAGDIVCALEQKDDKIEIGFTSASKNGVVIPYGFFSSGERVKIAKAVSLALNDLFNIGLYIDDEGVSYLDAAGTKTVFEFMSNHRPDSTRIFVTHSPSIQQDFKGSKIIVTKKNGIASVEVD